MILEKIDGKFRLLFNTEDSPFESEPLLGVKDTVFISGTVYAKTEEAFASATREATTVGYDISQSDPEGPSFHLEEISAAECGSCESVISPKGILTHNHRCECCGDKVYEEYTRDGAISLQFMRDRKEVGRGALAFRIFGYREPADSPAELLLYPDPLLKNYAPPSHDKRAMKGLRLGMFSVRDFDEARLILEEARDLYTYETLTDPLSGHDVRVMVVKDHTPYMKSQSAVFEAQDIVGQMFNFRDIKVFGTQKYDDFENLPVPDFFQLSRKYINGQRHTLTEPDIHETILTAAGQVSSTDFYHQDGRTFFTDLEYKRMTAFVEHFVDVDLEEWSIFLSQASEDGPGFIRNLAGWCAAMSDGQKRQVRCEPNLGNTLAGMGKLMAGGTLSYDESIAMEEGAETEQAHRLAGMLQGAFDERREGEDTAFGRRLEKWTQGSLHEAADESGSPDTDSGQPKGLENGPG